TVWAPWSARVVSHTQAQMNQEPFSVTSFARCQSPASTRAHTPVTWSPSSGSHALPYTRTAPWTSSPLCGPSIRTSGRWFPSPSHETNNSSTAIFEYASPSNERAYTWCQPRSAWVASHRSVQVAQFPRSVTSVASCQSPTSIRSSTFSPRSPRSWSPACPVLFTIPLTVAPSSGAVITTWGASSSGFSTRTTMDVSAARLELSYATATMWCHPFVHRVVSHVQDQVHHDPLPDVSVARLLSPASIPTSTFTTSPSGSHAFPVTSIVPLTVVPASGLVIATCGLISARPT